MQSPSLNKNKEDSLAHFFSTKWVDPSSLPSWAKKMKNQGKTIATLNGSFDLLHAGHLAIVYEASLQADILIVALNTDDSIKKYKGPKRPLLTLEHRAYLIASLEFVDYVTCFSEVDPRELLKKIVPDVHVNGAEYGENCIEAEVVKNLGARLHLVKREPGLSTTEIVRKIQADIT